MPVPQSTAAAIPVTVVAGSDPVTVTMPNPLPVSLPAGPQAVSLTTAAQTDLDSMTGYLLTLAGAIASGNMKTVLQAGAAAIGTVGVTSLPSLVLSAGAALIGQVQLAAGAAAIGSVSVSSLPSLVLAAGANAIGKLAANAGVIIGDVNVVALPSLVLAAGTAAIGKLASNAAGVLIGDVNIAAPTAAFNNQITITTAGTAQQINVASQAIVDGIEIVCDADSPGYLLLAFSSGNKAATGRKIYAGTTAYLRISNLNGVWLDGSVNSSKGSWSAS